MVIDKFDATFQIIGDTCVISRPHGDFCIAWCKRAYGQSYMERSKVL